MVALNMHSEAGFISRHGWLTRTDGKPIVNLVYVSPLYPYGGQSQAAVSTDGETLTFHETLHAAQVNSGATSAVFMTDDGWNALLNDRAAAE